MTTTRQLFINLKQQDRLREWFSKRGNVYDANLITNNISFGDSDVNYELCTRPNDIQILPAPYQAPNIRWKLTYSGDYNGLAGKISAYRRILFGDGKLYSVYDGNVKESVQVPNAIDNVDTSELVFGIDPVSISTSTDSSMGYVIFLETLPTGFTDNSGNQMRLPETYTITSNLPDSLTSLIIEQNTKLFQTSSPHGLEDGDEVYIESSILSGLNRVMRISIPSSLNVPLLGYSISTYFYLIDSNGDQYTADKRGNIIIHKWSLTQDIKNGSFILSKGTFKTKDTVSQKKNYISITGNTSGLTKEIYFNI